MGVGEKSLENILKRQEEMETKLYNYLRERTGKSLTDKQKKGKGMELAKKRARYSFGWKTAPEQDVTKKWLRF